jgi:hypothetical protein
MIPKIGNRFAEKIMLKQQAKGEMPIKPKIISLLPFFASRTGEG